jgi:RNA polymerase sigma-70 factor (ECF subfamily)
VKEAVQISGAPSPGPGLRELLVQVVWRTAPRFQLSRGRAVNRVLPLAHRRALGRVRWAEASTAREHRAALV